MGHFKNGKYIPVDYEIREYPKDKIYVTRKGTKTTKTKDILSLGISEFDSIDRDDFNKLTYEEQVKLTNTYFADYNDLLNRIIKLESKIGV